MENLNNIFSYNNPGVTIGLHNMQWHISSKKIMCDIYNDNFEIKCILKKYPNSNRSDSKLDNDRFIMEYQKIQYLYFGFNKKEKYFDIQISKYVPNVNDIILYVYEADNFQFQIKLEIDYELSNQFENFYFKIKREN